MAFRGGGRGRGRGGGRGFRGGGGSGRGGRGGGGRQQDFGPPEHVIGQFLCFSWLAWWDERASAASPILRSLSASEAGNRSRPSQTGWIQTNLAMKPNCDETDEKRWR